MQHALILLHICSVALGEIERAAHNGLEALRGFAQNGLTQLDALKMEFVSLQTTPTKPKPRIRKCAAFLVPATVSLLIGLFPLLTCCTL